MKSGVQINKNLNLLAGDEPSGGHSLGPRRACRPEGLGNAS